MKVTFKIVNKCLWCDEKEIPMDKILCSVKCLKAINKAVKRQCGKDFSSYDMDDVKD